MAYCCYYRIGMAGRDASVPGPTNDQYHRVASRATSIPHRRGPRYGFVTAFQRSKVTT